MDLDSDFSFCIRNCEIKSMAPYGAFVEIAPGREGLCHISELSAEWLAKPEDVSSTHLLPFREIASSFIQVFTYAHQYYSCPFRPLK